MKNLGVVDPRTHGGRHNTPCYAHTRGIKSVSLSDILQDRMAQASPIHFRIICDAISAMDNGELDESQIKIFPTGEIRILSKGVKEGNGESNKDTSITA